MRILVDLSAGRATLDEPEEFTRFSVTLVGRGDLAQVVRSTGLGRVADDGEHVVVDQSSLRALAGPAATAAWEEGLSGMVAYAAGKGWVEADGGIVAHVERATETD